MQAPGPPPQGGEQHPAASSHPPPPPPQPQKPSLLAADLASLAAPDVGRPFSSVSDAVDRLMPYHVSTVRGRPDRGKGRQTRKRRAREFCTPTPPLPPPALSHSPPSHISHPQLLAQHPPEACDAAQLATAAAPTQSPPFRLLLGRQAALEEAGILSVRAVADGVARSAAAAAALAAALDAGALGLAPPPGTEGDPRPEEAWLMARLAAQAEAAALAEARAAAAKAGLVVPPPLVLAAAPALHAPPPLRGVGGVAVVSPPVASPPAATAYPPYAAGALPPPPHTAYGRR